MRRQVGPQSIASYCRYVGNGLRRFSRERRRDSIGALYGWGRPEGDASVPACGVRVVGALGGLGEPVARVAHEGPAVGADEAELAVAAGLHVVLGDPPQLAERRV